MNTKTKKSVSYWLIYIALPVSLLIVWELYDLAGQLKPYAMPAPAAIVDTIAEYVKNGKLLANLGISFLRVTEGFLIALAAAFIMGICVSLFNKFNIFTDFAIQILRPIPPIAWIPLAILWFGIGEGSKVFIIFLGAFFPIFLNTVDGIKGIDNKYFELAKVYEIQKSKLIKKVVIPGALPQIMTGIRLGIGSAWVCVVAAEMIGATRGIGFMLSNGRSLSRPDIVILGMLIIGIVGKIMDDLLIVIGKKIIKW